MTILPVSTARVSHFIFTFAQNSDALQSHQACPEMRIRVPAGTTAGLQTSFSIDTSVWQDPRTEIYKANSLWISRSPANGESGWDPDVSNTDRLQPLRRVRERDFKPNTLLHEMLIADCHVEVELANRTGRFELLSWDRCVIFEADRSIMPTAQRSGQSALHRQVKRYMVSIHHGRLFKRHEARGLSFSLLHSLGSGATMSAARPQHFSAKTICCILEIFCIRFS
jgi:hypothetical protein